MADKDQDLNFVVGDNARQELIHIVERVERLNEEKGVLQEDIAEIFEEAKDTGFDLKILRKVIQLRKMDEKDRKAQEEMIELYMGELERGTK